MNYANLLPEEILRLAYPTTELERVLLELLADEVDKDHEIDLLEHDLEAESSRNLVLEGRVRQLRSILDQLVYVFKSSNTDADTRQAAMVEAARVLEEIK